MIARAMAAVATNGIVFFASGVSDSTCRDPEAFARERRILERTRDARLLVYFSTVTVANKKPNPYAQHKQAMEELVRTGDHLILRLGNVVGPGQARHQLIPALVEQVKSGHVRIQRGARRDLLDIQDLVDVLRGGLLHRKNETLNLNTGHLILVEDLVRHIEKLLSMTAEKTYLTAVEYPEYPVLRPSISLPFADPNYYQRVLEKYVR